MLDIRLLGSPMVTVDGATIDVDTRKAIAMLAYLAVEGAADRETLAALFWADSSPDRARATLRRTLSALRAGVGPDTVVADRNQVALAPGFHSDIDEFTDAITETAGHGHSSDDVCERCVAPLAAATALYRGDFLGAFAVRDSPEFEDWARPVTESYRLQAGSAFQRLAMARAMTGDYTGAIAAAGRWIELDELHEPAHRLLMLLHAWSGDRPGAIQAYRNCVAILDRELGVAPLEETTELYEAILDEDLPPAPGLPRTVRAVRQAPPKPPAEILDRRNAIETLTRLLDPGEDGRLWVVSGDSWMGKTRLVEHIVESAAAGGHTVASARAYRAEEHLPYGVATQLLEPLTGSIDLDAAPQWALEELTRLAPRLIPGQPSLPPERLGQLRLREAFATFVETVSADSPTLITIDDAQWMDSASAALVAYLLRRRETHRAAVVISTRDTAALPAPVRERIAGADHHVHLEPLTAADLRADYPDVDLETAIAATNGIPLLVKEALDTGTVSRDSATVTRYMESRYERLTDLSRQVIAAAAVLDGMCDAPLLRDTSGRTDDEIVEAVEELVTAGLLREQPDGRLGFTLDVLESLTYDSMSLIRRRLLHRRAAEAIEARPRSRTDARLATATAGHLRAAGSDEAAEWYRLSGDLARAVFANDEAEASYETAIALGHPDVGGLHLALGELGMARGDYQMATRELRAAVSQSSGSTLALVEHRIGDLNRILGRFELAEESFERARTGHPLLSDLDADWALLRHRVGDPDTAIALATEALESARSSEDPDMTARALNILGVVCPEPDIAMGYLRAALDMTGPVDSARMAALNNLAYLVAREGDHETAIGLVNDAIAIASKAGYRHQHAALLNHLADLNHQSGKEQEAEKALTEAVTIFADIDSGAWEPEVWLLRQW